MKILVVSDEESPYIWDYFDPDPFRDVELIISCGDLNALYLSFLATMIPAEIVYVHGNHDSRYITAPPEGCTSIDDTLFTYKNIRILGLGGAKSPRKVPFEYSERQMQLRILRRQFDILRSGGIDILVSHAPCRGIGDINDTYHQGFQSLRDLVVKYQPKYHFYGHVHTRYGMIETEHKLGNTTLINCCGYRVIEV